MASIFTKDDKFVEKPNRNSFDLSFQNNLSLKFGKLVPCFCQEVLPGDSFRIKPTFGLRFLPQVFPVQTRMRAHLHFFYVRNRTIWKDWKDFIGKTKSNLTPPYLVSQSYEDGQTLKESSIYDYMGLPVTVQANESVLSSVWSSRGKEEIRNIRLPNGSILDSNAIPVDKLNSSNSQFQAVPYYVFPKPINPKVQNEVKLYFDGANSNNINFVLLVVKGRTQQDDTLREFYIPIGKNTPSGTVLTFITQGVQYTFDGSNDVLFIDSYVGYTRYKVGNITNVRVTVEVDLSLNGSNYPLTGIAYDSLPYGDGESQMRISALPFRAYEAIYNSFYRNAENNPFKINGVPEYNVYVKSIEGGAQRFSDFKLYNRNWEDDAFTTAVPTPQQGDAPLIGLTGTPNEPVKLHYHTDDDRVGEILLRSDDNGTITMVDTDTSVPQDLSNGLNDMINFGITINDLRNVNAFTLWKEKNIRKGYKYPDQMMSHYGVSISYNELLMPEFIGGVSRDVTVNQISQTVETSTGNLGDMAGQAYVVGDGQSVSKYCDEHGFIIGIMSVVPVPNYSQMIPKHFFKHDAFDYFFPEFGKIGMQPISNKEIASTASWLRGNKDDTFGYQRAWYDYLANVDQVHGKFNSDFYNFLLQRKFSDVPQLGEEFTTVISDQLNNIFYSDDDEDKILGQVYFDVKAIRPIPLYGIPSLE